MANQNIANHKQYVIGYHFIAFGLLMVIFFAALIRLFTGSEENSQTGTNIILLLIAIYSILTFFYARVFALKAQDRAIRAEESIRHLTLTGKPIDNKLSIRQIVALRFASDEEFPKLCIDAVSKNLSPDEIKKEIKNWKEDSYRV